MKRIKITNEQLSALLNENSRLFIPKVRGGWTEKKIINYLKHNASEVGLKAAIKEIASFDNVNDLKNHLFWHGSQTSHKKLSPSITKSEKWAATNGGGGYGMRYYGISLTNVKKIATNFDYLHAMPAVHVVILKKDAVIKNMEGKITDSSEINDIIVDLYTEGVDAVWIGGGEGEMVVINPYSIINVHQAVQFFDMRYGRSEKNPSFENPVDEELIGLMDMCKEYLDFTNKHKEPITPKKPMFTPKKEWPNYEDDMKIYKQRMENYNKYIQDPSEIDNKIRPFKERRDKILNMLKFNKKQ